jgi:hypothetical protein
MFLHIENIQPRLVERDVKQDEHGEHNLQYWKLKWNETKNENEWVCRNDYIAPSPGFTAAQMDRLALIYVVASVRRGSWMIPAFHAAVDAGISDAHDDPQNFDLADWAGRICQQVKAIGGSCPAVQQ